MADQQGKRDESRTRTYRTTLQTGHGDKPRIAVSFDPDAAWGTKSVHHVNGTVAGIRVRVTLVRDEDGWSFSLGPNRLPHVAVGDEIEVVITPEGPQRGDLAPDIAAALDADPAAGEFFDTLAQFYRNGYLRWIDGTKRRPDVRAERIAEMVHLLHEGVKSRPRT